MRGSGLAGPRWAHLGVRPGNFLSCRATSPGGVQPAGQHRFPRQLLPPHRRPPPPGGSNGKVWPAQNSCVELTEILAPIFFFEEKVGQKWLRMVALAWQCWISGIFIFLRGFLNFAYIYWLISSARFGLRCPCSGTGLSQQPTAGGTPQTPTSVSPVNTCFPAGIVQRTPLGALPDFPPSIVFWHSGGGMGGVWGGGVGDGVAECGAVGSPSTAGVPVRPWRRLCPPHRAGLLSSLEKVLWHLSPTSNAFPTIQFLLWFHRCPCRRIKEDAQLSTGTKL